MSPRVWFVSLSIALLFTVACASGKKKPPTTAVKGTVNLDGKAMAEGEISFVTEGEAPSVMEVKNGTYSGTSFVGKNRVEVRAYKTVASTTTPPPPKQNYIPTRFNDQSKLTADVTQGGANDFKFDVTSQ